MSRDRSGPSPMLIVIVAAFIVFGGYYIWSGFLSFLDDQGNITAPATHEAGATETAQAKPARPTLYYPPTFTPLPPCQTFKVNVDRAAYRECPSKDDQQCPKRDVMTYGTEVCVYGRAPENPEWYIVDLNPEGAFRDMVYMHESVIVPANPTPTPTITFTPLPTISPTPSLPATARPSRTPIAPTFTPSAITI